MKRLGVAVFTIVTLVFIGGLTAWGIGLISTGTLPGVVAGGSVIFFAALGVWSLWAELLFGYHAQRLGELLEAAGELPAEGVGLHPSGRIMRSDAEALLPRYKSESEAAPEDWKATYRLGLVLDALGERKDARATIRRAIRLENSLRRSEAR